MRKEIFQRGKSCLAATLQPLRLQSGNKRKNRRKSKTPGALIYNVPGSRSGGIQLRSVRSIVVQSPWGGLCTPFRANKLGALPAVPDFPTGEPLSSFARGLLVPNQRFCRFFRFFPLPSGICLVFPFFPVFAACFLAFPPVSRRV